MLPGDEKLDQVWQANSGKVNGILYNENWFYDTDA